MSHRVTWVGWVLLAACLLAPCLAQASSLEHLATSPKIAPVDLAPLQRVLEATIELSKGWTLVLQEYAWKLFKALALLQLTWTGIRLLLQGQNLSSALLAIGLEAVLFCVFGLLLEHGPQMAEGIIVDLENLGKTAAAEASRVHVQTLVDDAIAAFVKTVGKISMLTLTADLLGMVVGLLVLLVVFAAITAMIFIARVQAYVVIGAGSVLLGCGGATWTREFVGAYFKHALGAGLKLMFIELIQSVFVSYMHSWLRAGIESPAFSLELLGTALASGVVLLVMLITVPEYLSAMLTGGVMGFGERVLAGAAIGAGLGVGKIAGKEAGRRVQERMSPTAAAAGGAGVGSAGSVGAGARPPAAAGPASARAGLDGGGDGGPAGPAPSGPRGGGPRGGGGGGGGGGSDAFRSEGNERGEERAARPAVRPADDKKGDRKVAAPSREGGAAAQQARGAEAAAAAPGAEAGQQGLAAAAGLAEKARGKTKEAAAQSTERSAPQAVAASTASVGASERSSASSASSGSAASDGAAGTSSSTPARAAPEVTQTPAARSAFSGAARAASAAACSSGGGGGGAVGETVRGASADSASAAVTAFGGACTLPAPAPVVIRRAASPEGLSRPVVRGPSRTKAALEGESK